MSEKVTIVYKKYVPEDVAYPYLKCWIVGCERNSFCDPALSNPGAYFRHPECFIHMPLDAQERHLKKLKWLETHDLEIRIYENGATAVRGDQFHDQS